MSVRVCHMINFHEQGKMLREFLIFSLCFVAINAAGQFQVVDQTKGITFSGQDTLQSEYISDVFNVALGNAPKPDAKWSAMTITDPFSLPHNGILVLIEGISKIDLDRSVHSFKLKGDRYRQEVEDLLIELRSAKYKVCDINQDAPLAMYNWCVKDALTEAPVQSSKRLGRPLDLPFLQMIAIMHSLTDNLDAIAVAETFVTLRVDVDEIRSVYGDSSEALREALSMISTTITELADAAQIKYRKGVFIGVIASDKAAARTKREVVGPSPPTENPLNLAEYYNEDYPVIFNIILWFMVVFGLSLLAICYAIGAMDPGRDSIIYRMTSTRMKKDN